MNIRVGAKQGTDLGWRTPQSQTADRWAAQTSSSAQIRVRQRTVCGDIWDHPQ